MTATSPYLNHPVRTEREAVLEAALRRAEMVVAEVCEGQHPDNVCCHVLREIRATLSTTGGSNV